MLIIKLIMIHFLICFVYIPITIYYCFSLFKTNYLRKKIYAFDDYPNILTSGIPKSKLKLIKEVLDLTSNIIDGIEDLKLNIVICNLSSLGMCVNHLNTIYIDSILNGFDTQKVFLHELICYIGFNEENISKLINCKKNILLNDNLIFIDYDKKHLDRFMHSDDLMTPIYNHKNKIGDEVLLILEHLGWKINKKRVNNHLYDVF